MASVLRPNSALHNVHAFSTGKFPPTLHNASAAIASSAYTFQPDNLNCAVQQIAPTTPLFAIYSASSAQLRRDSCVGSAANAWSSYLFKMIGLQSSFFQLHFQGFNAARRRTAPCAGQTCDLRDLPQFKLLCEPQQY